MTVKVHREDEYIMHIHADEDGHIERDIYMLDT